MIPKRIHYCWFGGSQLPELAQKCIASWHSLMPDYEYKLWNEENFDVNQIPYTKEAYEAKRYAFVSDYVRLWALEKDGGIYLDVDFFVYKSFDDLLHLKAFAGFEGSKHLPMMMGVIASEAHGVWVKEQLMYYQDRHFVTSDGKMDLTTNVQFVSEKMRNQGFVQNGEEQDYKDLHIFPVDYFCPRQTTQEYFKTGNTHCESLGLASWLGQGKTWKTMVVRMIDTKSLPFLIKLKRKLFG